MANSFDMVGPIFTLPVPPQRKTSEYLTAYKGWVYSATSKIAREVSQVKLKLYKKRMVRRGRQTGIEIDEVFEHEALSVLHHANDFMTMPQLIELTQIYLDLTGEAAWALLRVGGRVSEIWPLRPDWIDILPSKKSYIQQYEYHPGGGFDKVVIKPEDMLFLKYLNPETAYRGKGGVQASAMAIDIDEFMSDWNRTFFFNSAIPSIFFSTDKEIGEAESKRLMKMWRSKFEGRSNAHKVAFLGKGLTPHEVGSSKRDMEFLDGKKYYRDEILAAFQVSKANLGIVEDVNRANQEASDARFVKSVVKPRMIALVQYLNEFFLRNWPDEGLFFDFEDPTPEDVELKLKVYDNGLKNGWLTINEVRERENLDPVDGGDAVYIPFSLQPLGSSRSIGGKMLGMFGKKQDEESGLLTLKVKGKTNKQAEQGRIRKQLNLPIPPRRLSELRKEKIEKKIQHDLVKLVVNLMQLKGGDIKSVSKDYSVSKKGFTGKEAFWRAMVAKTDVLEQRMRGILTNLWEEQQSAVLIGVGNEMKAAKVTKKAIDDAIFGMDEENARWVRTLSPFLRELVIDKGREIFVFLGMPRDLDLATRRAQDFLLKRGLQFVDSVNTTTREDLRKLLAEAVGQGQGIDEVSSAISGYYSDTIANRGEMVARSEIIRATNFATEEAYIQSDIVEAKEWLTALDNRTCHFCMQMDGKIITLNTNWFNEGDIVTAKDEDGKVQTLNIDYGSVKYPPLHPRCRYTLIPVLKE